MICKAGTRIRLILGDAKKNYGPNIQDRQTYVEWIAGIVPVGSTGTLYLPEKRNPNYNPLMIKWDGIEPKDPRYSFSLGVEEGCDLPYQFEEVTGPTEEGKKRFPPNGLYETFPCTCKPECPDPCKDSCKCPACQAEYGDYLSCDFD